MVYEADPYFRLGDIPDPEELVPNTGTLADVPSVAEVNGIGEEILDTSGMAETALGAGGYFTPYPTYDDPGMGNGGGGSGGGMPSGNGTGSSSGVGGTVLSYGDPDDFAGGQAPEGTVVHFDTPTSTPFAKLFEGAARKYDVDVNLLLAVAEQESAFDPNAVSPAGAQGLMQLMPGTADGLGVTNSFDPAQAIDGGAKLLSQLLKQFDSTELALAAYNAGPGAVEKYGGIPPYEETQNYVQSVMALFNQRDQSQGAQQAPLPDWRQGVVKAAQKMLGVPYVWGGTSYSGVDCSGLVQLMFKGQGITLPRVSYQQANFGETVPLDELKPGDLVAWDNSSRNVGADHIAIYIGNGQIIEAPSPGSVVQVSNLYDTAEAWGVSMAQFDPFEFRNPKPRPAGRPAPGPAVSGGSSGSSPSYSNPSTPATHSTPAPEPAYHGSSAGYTPPPPASGGHGHGPRDAGGGGHEAPEVM